MCGLTQYSHLHIQLFFLEQKYEKSRKKIKPGTSSSVYEKNVANISIFWLVVLIFLKLLSLVVLGRNEYLSLNVYFIFTVTVEQQFVV